MFSALRERLLTWSLLLLFPFCALAQPVEVTIDPAKRYQTMSGWEVTVYLTQFGKAQNHFDPSWHQYQDQIIDTLVDDIGVNRVRLELCSNSENSTPYWSQFESGAISQKDMQRRFYHKVNDNNDPFKADPARFHFEEIDYQVERVLLPMAKRLKAKGEKLYINLCFVDFDKGKNQTHYNHAQNPEEYAELVSQVFIHLKTKYGIVPDGLEVILEPDHTARWKHSGRLLGEAAAAAMKRLTPLGFKPELILPSTKRAALAVKLFEEAMQVPGVRQYVGAISYHRYARATPEVLRGITATADRYGIRTEMLELVKGNSYHLHQDVQNANASAWQSFGIATWAPDDGRPRRGMLVYVDKETGETTPSHQGRRLMQYMRYIRGGEGRLGAVVEKPKFFAVAFENPDGGQVAVIRAEIKGPIAIHGLKPGKYAATFANWKSGENPVKVAQSQGGGPVTVQMPTKSVVTVFPTTMAQ